jgi:hypothetical protein
MDFVATSIFTHVVSIYLLLAAMVFNIYSVINVTDFISLSKRLRVMTPIFHTLNLIVAYTGMIVSAFSHDISWTVIFMTITTILILVLEIKRYKKMRVIKSTQIDKQKEFYDFAKKIYLIEIGALVFTFILTKIF